MVLRFPLQPLQKPGLNRCQRERGGEELCPLLPAPESFLHPPESPPTPKTPQRGPVGSYPPVPQPPWYKRGPEDPASPPGSHLRAMPLTTPTHRSTAIPEPPGPAAGGTRPEMPGWQRALAAAPGTAHIWPVPASSIHRRAGQRGAGLLKGSQPLAGGLQYSLRAEPGAGRLDGLSYPLTAVLDKFCGESWRSGAGQRAARAHRGTFVLH